MRLQLIHPGFDYKGRDLFPLGLGYLASAVEDIAQVKVVDEGVAGFNMEDLQAFGPDMVGLSCTTPSFPRGTQIIEEIKNLRPDIPLVLGGVHGTFMANDALKAGADVVVRGEGEQVLRELVEGKDPAGIKGISYRNNHTHYHNPDRPPIEDLDSISFPAHHLFSQKDYPIMSVVTSRGCPYSCAYCSATRFWGKRARFRSPQNVIDELKVIKGIGHRMVRFMDSTFTFKKERVQAILSGMISEGLDFKWSCETRADHLTDEIFNLLSKAGCELICLGVDSGCQGILDNINRRIDVQTMRRAFAKSREHDIPVRAYVTFGLPGETEKTMLETLRFLDEMRPEQVILSLATAYPGTEFFGKKTADIHPNWVTKFKGHGQGAELYLSDTLTKREYTKLGDKMWHEIKRMKKEWACTKN